MTERDTELMRRVGLIVVCLSVALAWAAVIVTAPGSARTGGPPTLASNKAAARVDAAKLLTEVAVPAGARRVSAEPTGDHGYLRPLAHLSANPGYVDHRWWIVSAMTPDQAIAAVSANRPPDVQDSGTGGGGNTKTGTSATGVNYFLKNVTGVLESRIIEVTATALGGGRTGIIAETQSQWVVPRTAAERIPSGTQVITVRETDIDSGQVLESATVTSAPKIAATVRFFNGLANVQPGSSACPAELVPTETLTVSFLPAVGVTPLASAQFSGDFDQGDDGTSDQCHEVDLTIAKSSVGLIGGDYVPSINRLLGTDIP